ncbi:hypothetical protein DNHGIG_31720 [Collibacillus ludicampi]|uniref:Uncharacterized protein n=1 Tax=Collibacillus ludicampi TaxID=2771369 RepID=A0AAV4LJ10_9BACL|nr:hypothetical protein [Collibacillus ludicampi]GIM47623.1 hypothetical protein DNHGIG_31720 [Collibacillus ludicampi]
MGIGTGHGCDCPDLSGGAHVPAFGTGWYVTGFADFSGKTEQEWMKVEATQVDTTFLSPEEVAAYVLELVKERKQECLRN